MFGIGALRLEDGPNKARAHAIGMSALGHKQTKSTVIRARMPVKTAFLVLGDARIPPSPCDSTRKL